MDKTECTAHDACWALEAHEGKIVEAVIDIALAQRNALNDAVSLPGKEEVEQTDWDGELRDLNEMQKKSKQGPGKDFEQAGFSIGMDGLEERNEKIKRKAQVDGFKRLLDKGEIDQDWLPGKQNPKPVDDEPWFTG